MAGKWTAGLAVVLAIIATRGTAQTYGDELEFDEWDAQICHTAYGRAQLALAPAENPELRTRMEFLQFSYSFVPLLPEAPRSDEARRELAATLQYCENMLEFQPALDFSYLIPAQPTTQDLTDLHCAAAYWLHGAATPDDQRGALARAKFALGKHHEANPDHDPETLGPQVIQLGQARGQRIQEGQESIDGLVADLRACEAKYGFAPGGTQ